MNKIVFPVTAKKLQYYSSPLHLGISTYSKTTKKLWLIRLAAKMNLPADSALILAAVILIFSILWPIRKLINSGKRTPFLPPGPGGLPILGYLPFLRKDLHHQFTELAGKYGPIYKLWLGNKLCTVISSRSHKRVAQPEKNFVREMLSNTNLEATYNLRREEVRKVVKEIYSKIGTPMDICELAFKIDLNVIINLIWGGKIQGERRDRILTSLLPVLANMLDLLVKPNISDFFPALARFDIQGVAKEMTTLLQRVEGITKDAIDERMKNPSKKMEAVEAKKDGRTDFLQILVDLMQEEDNKESLGEAQIKAIAIVPSKVMEKVQNELNEIVGLNNIVEEFHIPKLEYLDAVLKETLRVSNRTLLNPKNSKSNLHYWRIHYPKDSAVFLNVWSIQRDPLAWENPLEFKPERFLGNTTKWDFSGNNFNYIPFGSGRRVCAGLPLAERMIRYVLASLLHSFEWQLPEGEKLDMSDKLVMALRKKIPLTAVPIPRLYDPDLYE
ncbi:cytochrome [Sesamum angolense]|uniref:Cytochrome n=1 Tax=Sesamum angolense TaxID=2727404 RepID=A0AAE2BL61_9LAMI|nr:cytochrome [Sesamum angolense]